MIDINPSRNAVVTFYIYGGFGQLMGINMNFSGLPPNKWYLATMYYADKAQYDAGTPTWYQNFDESTPDYIWISTESIGFHMGMSHYTYLSPVVIKVLLLETDTFEFVAERYFMIEFPRIVGSYEIIPITDTYRADVFATIEVKNTGNVIYAPRVGFSIRPSNLTQWKDAPITQGYASHPGIIQTINTGVVRLPINTHGRVYAWITVYDPNNNELARIGGPGDTSVYFDVP